MARFRTRSFAKRPGMLLLAAGMLIATSAASSAPAGAAEFRSSNRIIHSVAGGISGWAGHLNYIWEPAIDAEISRGRLLQRTELLLNNFVHRDLDASALARIESEFGIFRAKGIKVIPRVQYINPDNWYLGYRAPDANLEQVLRHIAQLGPIFRRNADVIAAVQAGFAGAWGEWHSSANRLDEEPARSRIRDALLDALPDTVPIQFRAPSALRDWYGSAAAVPAASNGGARIGIHNDCMLSGPDDSYTFPDGAVRKFSEELGQRATYGGETCTQVSPRVQCEEILRDGRSLGLNWISAYGALAFYEQQWRAEGCFDTIRRMAGPRIEIASVTADNGGQARVRVALRNVGWSPINDNRNLVVRLASNSGSSVDRVVSVRPRDWKPGDASAAPVTIELPLNADASLPAGTYTVALGLPDASSRLSGDARYVLPFANDDDASRGQSHDTRTGFFNTGVSVTVGGR